MAARFRASNPILGDFPSNPHENRFAAANRANPLDNPRSKSYHGKCVCDICTCGKHHCPPSVSPNKYPKDMRSTSQDAYRPFKPKEIKEANQQLETTKKTLHRAEPGRVLPNKPEKGHFETSNQKNYPNHWQKDIDTQQLRYPTNRSAHQQSFELFPKEVPADHKQSPKPVTQRSIDRSPVSKSIDTTIPAGVSSRGRSGTSPTPRRANDTSPDFPLAQPSWTPARSHVHRSPYTEIPESHSIQSEYDSAESPAADFSKTKVKPVKYDSRRTPEEASPYLESPNQTIKNVYDQPSRDEPPALPPRDDYDEYESNRVLSTFKKDRYGKRGIPKPQTNQTQLVPQRQAAGSPPKKHAEFSSKRSSARTNRAWESQNRPQEAVYHDEPQENRPPNRFASRKDSQYQNEGYASRKSDASHPSDREAQSFRTPAKERDYLSSARPKITEESAMKSPNHTATPTRVINRDNLIVDRSLPLDGNTTYNQDFRYEPPKSRGGSGQVDQKPAASSTVRDSDQRAYGKIRSVKYDDIRTAYQDEYKEMPASCYLKKDCPMQGLPKPPKIITAGKLHVYYDEHENDWN